MQNVLKIISYIGLLLTVVPAFLVFSGVIDLDSHKALMLLGTLLWFFSAPFWMNRQKQPEGKL